MDTADLKKKAHQLKGKMLSDEDLEKIAEETFGEETPKESSVLTIGKDFLKSIQGVGMSRVDPGDIRPPQIILVQKSSDLTTLQDKQGKQANVGQFFHTGKREIYDIFECYWLFASKSTYVDRRKEEQPEREQYSALGAMVDDLSLFAMLFRSSAIFTLSPLFTASQTNHAPMFSFKIKMETKKLEGEKGSWYIPVCRIGEIVKDEGVFDELYQLAKRFDEQADNTADKLKGEDESE